MLQAYTSVNQTVAENSPISFNITKFSTSCNASIANSNAITLKKGGYYMITFNATGAPSSAGNASAQLYINGTQVADAISSAYSGATTENASLGFSTIIQVRPSCAVINNNPTLQVINTGAETVFSSANIIITKLG